MMKKIILTTVCFVILINLQTFAETKSVVKLSPGSLLISNKLNSLGYEEVASDNSSDDSQHFVTVWTGYGINHMNVNVYNAKLAGVDLEAGDEIGIFDGTLCVGAAVLTNVLSLSSYLNVKVSADDGSGNGYTPEHTINYKFFDKSENKEISNIVPVYYTANPVWGSDGKFAIGKTTFVQLSSGGTVNNPPVANAGTDQSVIEGSVVTLDGSKSNDFDGNSLSFNWTSREGVLLNTPNLMNPTFIAPMVTHDTNYVFNLMVSDGKTYSTADQVTISILNQNHPPVISNPIQDFSTEQFGLYPVSIASTFFDEDGDELTFGINSSDTSIVKLNVEEFVLFLTVVGNGTSNIVVSASDGNFNSVDTFIVRVGTTSCTPPTSPVVGTITQPTCSTATGSVVLNGLPSGSWTLTQSPGGVTISGSSISYQVTDLPAGASYTFTVTNSAGCISGASANVVIDAAPSAPSTPTLGIITQPTCSLATGSVVLNGLPATGTWTLTRTPGGITTTGTGTSKTITGLSSGTYTYTVTNAAGCISGASANVVIDAQPAAPATPATTLIQPTCSVATGTITVTAPKGTGMTYSIDNIDYSNTSGVFKNVKPGIYFVTAKNSFDCISNASEAVIFPVPPLLYHFDNVEIIHPTCINPKGSIKLGNLPQPNWVIKKNPSESMYYSGSDETYTLANLDPGTYAITVSVGSCTSEPIKVTFEQPITPSPPSISNVVNGRVTLTNLPNYGDWTITQNPGNIIFKGSGSTYIVTGLSVNHYTFTVTNKYGCTSPPSYQVDITTGNETEISEPTVLFYPNPFDKTLNFEGFTNTKQIKIHNVSGQCVMDILYPVNPINTEEFNDGVYIISVFDMKGNLKKEKMVKRESGVK